LSKIVLLLAGLSLALAACGAGTAGSEQQNEGTISRTIVRFRPDGSKEVTTDQITPQQQRAEVAAREQMLQHRDSNNASTATISQGISADPSCDAADLWLFDDYYRTGANELCFYGGGTAYLSDYSTWYCGPTYCFFGSWRNSVRSYWAGVSGGTLWELVGEIFYHDNFAPWQRVDNAGVWADHSYAVSLDF
jgi:hypothetical protein